MGEEAVEHAELLFRTIVEIRRVEPQVKCFTGSACPREPERELGVGHLRQDETARAVAGQNLHRARYVDERTALLRGRRPRRQRQRLVDEVRDLAKLPAAVA